MYRICVFPVWFFVKENRIVCLFRHNTDHACFHIMPADVGTARVGASVFFLLYATANSPLNFLRNTVRRRVGLPNPVVVQTCQLVPLGAGELNWTSLIAFCTAAGVAWAAAGAAQRAVCCICNGSQIWTPSSYVTRPWIERQTRLVQRWMKRPELTNGAAYRCLSPGRLDKPNFCYGTTLRR